MTLEINKKRNETKKVAENDEACVERKQKTSALQEAIPRKAFLSIPQRLQTVRVRHEGSTGKRGRQRRITMSTVRRRRRSLLDARLHWSRGSRKKQRAASNKTSQSPRPACFFHHLCLPLVPPRAVELLRADKHASTMADQKDNKGGTLPS